MSRAYRVPGALIAPRAARRRRASSEVARLAAWAAGSGLLPLVGLLVVWGAINTGPWALQGSPTGVVGWIHATRAAAPLLLLVLFALGMRGKHFPAPMALWVFYGVVGAFGSAFSPAPLSALYWAALYLAVLAVTASFLREPDPVAGARRLNLLTWALTVAVLGALLFAARDVLFVGSGLGISGYGVVNRMDSVAGMPMSRATGLARFAAIPGVVAFTAMFRRFDLRWLGFAGVFLYASFLIYALQSRGALFGFLTAIAFVLLFQGRRSRAAAAVLLFVLVLVQVGGVVPKAVEDTVMRHVLRGQSSAELRTLTGRTAVWQRALDVAQDSPVVGFGPQADRALLRGEHVHNTYLYALLQSGVVGAAAFVAGLAWTWWAFVGLVRRRRRMTTDDRLFLVQVGAVLAFFTVRSIPEVSGAMFGVDLLIMAPALGAVAVLHERYVRGRRRLVVRSGARSRPIRGGASHGRSDASAGLRGRRVHRRPPGQAAQGGGVLGPGGGPQGARVLPHRG